MTMFKPNIKIKHLAVYKSGEEAYSENFHSGLNIIRGQNSSGKSTIMDFLFFALGGEILSSQWRDTAEKCDSVTLGVSLNGNDVTISRDIEKKNNRPMRIFMGHWEEAKSSAHTGWEIYPYSRGNKDSFSQVLFRLLGLPEVQYDEQNTKITMNQILRLIYSDQLSPVDKIFKMQPFDSAITRQTVGDLICGAYSDIYYKSKLRLIDADVELKSLMARKKTLINAHAQDGHPLNMEWLNEERKQIEGEIDKVNHEIEQLEKQIFSTQFDDRLTLNDQQSTYEKIVVLQEELGELKSELNKISLEIIDSDNFIKSLDTKIQQLDESSGVINQFDELSFQFCPSCRAPANEYEMEGACNLCKSPFDNELIKKRSARLINEFYRQKEQSENLQEIRKKTAASIKAKIANKMELWEQAGKHYRVALRTPTTELRSKLRELNRDAGYLYRSQEELALKKEIIERIDEINHQISAITREMEELKDKVATEENKMKIQRARAYELVEAEALSFLKNDLKRQSSFSKARHFNFEFDSDRMAVDNDSFFSASSMVYMKNSFLTSLLFAAVKDKNFYHPRILILDTVEDKGMEPDRSMNFQRLIAKRSEEAISEHQIILATSMIAPELNIAKYTVGEFYTHENRSLKILG